MHLTEDQLQTIEEMAELFYSLDDIADNIEVDVIKLQDLYDEKTEVFQRYRKGYLTADMKLRKSISLSAEQGSNPAQILLTNLRNAITI